MKEYIIDKARADQKEFHVNTKVQNNKDRIIEGYASTRFPDRVNDIVDPQALAKAMDLYMKNPIMYRQHDAEQGSIGKVLDYKITADGLFIRAQIINDPRKPVCDELWAEIEFGSTKSLSIGFIPLQVEFEGDNVVITELELLEISVVTIPCNRESQFSIAKAFLAGTDLIDKKMEIKGWEKTKHQFSAAAAIIIETFKGLPTDEKIAVESILARVQNAIKAESDEEKAFKALQDEIALQKLEMEIFDSEAELLNLSRESLA